jgi:antirestriction protein ArdC
MGESLILRFYDFFNGQPVSIEQLIAYRQKVENYVDSIGSGEYVPKLSAIKQTVTKAIKDLQAKGITDIEKMELVNDPKPVLYKPKTNPLLPELEKIKKELNGLKKSTLYKKPEPIIDDGLKDTKEVSLFGLENIQNDKDYYEGGLGALGELNNTAYKVITDRILELIEDNGLIWRQPWEVGKAGYKTSLAHNYVTKRLYRGGNSYLTWLHLQGAYVRRNGKKVFIKYSNPFFFTFNQVSKLKGKIKEGEKGWPVLYFKYIYKNIATNKLVEPEVALINGKLKPGYDKIPAVFYYTVFNHDQTEGVKVKVEKVKPKTEKEKIESAELIVENMPNPPKIERVGTDAFYQRATDLVRVPEIEFFKQEQNFYSVLFHELIHSTGHEKRVYREREAGRKFGDKKYAFEELIAELGASFLCGESGIFYFTVNNSAAYIKNWSQKLREELKADPKFYYKAAGQAQKAADYILDQIDKPQIVSPTNEEKEVTPIKKAPEKLQKTTSKKEVNKKESESADRYLELFPFAEKYLSNNDDTFGNKVFQKDKIKPAVHSLASSIYERMFDYGTKANIHDLAAWTLAIKDFHKSKDIKIEYVAEAGQLAVKHNELTRKSKNPFKESLNKKSPKKEEEKVVEKDKYDPAKHNPITDKPFASILDADLKRNDIPLRKWSAIDVEGYRFYVGIVDKNETLISARTGKRIKNDWQVVTGNGILVARGNTKNDATETAKAKVKTYYADMHRLLILSYNQMNRYDLKGLPSLFSEPTTTNDQPTTKEKPKTLSGIDYTYTAIELGPYKPDFERLFSDTVVGIYGLPGHGKTTYLLKLAQYFATQGKKVLFVAREEYGRSEFDIKLKEHNIGHPNLTFNRVIDPEELKAADIAFLDSVNALGLNAKRIEEIYLEYPNKLWFLILQSIKSGNFRGSQEWEHVVSVFGEIQNRKLILRKNRLDPNNSAKAAELQKTNAITEAKKKAEVKEAVKTAMAKPQPVPPATGNQQPATIQPIAA